MLTDIVVNFTSKGRKLRAIVPKNGSVQGVLILDGDARGEFAGKHGFTLVPKAVPPGVTVKDSSNKTVTLAATEQDGPGVCYLVGSSLVCW